MVEKAVSFDSGGHRSFGILHQPSVDRRGSHRIGILLLNAGIRSRIGPYRQYVRFARRLCAEGFFVLRVDLPGIGDAEGCFSTWYEYAVNLAENTGVTSDVIDFFMQHACLDKLVLFGLCGGAHHALKTAASNRKVDWLVLAALPFQPLGNVDEHGFARLSMREYFGRAWRLHSWWKLLTLQLNLKYLRASLRHLLPLARRPGGDPVVQREFTSYLESGRQLLLVYGTDDPFYRGFCDEINAQEKLAALRGADGFELVPVEGANHAFTQICWQDRLLQAMVDWLSRRVPTSPRHVSPQTVESSGT
jgi:pimeloyl-ACP methyl ester carboxylesterase